MRSAPPGSVSLGFRNWGPPSVRACVGVCVDVCAWTCVCTRLSGSARIGEWASVAGFPCVRRRGDARACVRVCLLRCRVCSLVCWVVHPDRLPRQGRPEWRRLGDIGGRTLSERQRAARLTTRSQTIPAGVTEAEVFAQLSPVTGRMRCEAPQVSVSRLDGASCS